MPCTMPRASWPSAGGRSSDSQPAESYPRERGTLSRVTSPANLRFLTAGASPGLAAGWTPTITSSALGYGTYQIDASVLRRRAETFTYWLVGLDGYRFDGFEDTDLAVGNRDSFAVGWADGYAPAFTSGQTLTGMYDSGAHVFEAFALWGTAGYFLGPNVVGTNVTHGLYDAGAHTAENFTAWTAALAGYRTASFASSSAASFDAHLANASEMFRAVADTTWAAVSPPTSSLFCTVNTPAIDSAVLLTTTGTLPAGFALSTTYWVVASTAGVSFALAATRGGSAITATTAGTGIHGLTADPAYGWGGVLG